VMPSLLSEKVFFNLHQSLRTSDRENRLGWRNAVEGNLARLRLPQSDDPQSPINILRPKSLVVEILLPKNQRPICYGGTRFGEIVAVFKDSVKRRTTFTPYDSGAAASSPYTTTDRLKKEVRPLLSRNYFFRPNEATEYFEGHIWGKLGLEDVREFLVPPKTPASTLMILKKAGIPIFEYIEEKEGVEKNGYYQNYRRVRGKILFSPKTG